MTEERVVISCGFESCTFVETQVCARTGASTPCDSAVWSADEPDAYDETTGSYEAGTTAIGEEVGSRSTLPSEPPDDLGFHVGQELGLDDLGPLLNGGLYARVITILGDARAGKTSLLITFYLLLASGELEADGVSFAGSLTLPGFETRCRHTRVWTEGRAPDAMTARTLIGAGRGAGFMHLDLIHGAPARRARLLLSDLPGEWTRNLILNRRHEERLRFARRSDALLIVIDGEQLTSGDRWAVLEEQTLLLDRLSELLGANLPPLAMVATRADIIGSDPPPVLLDLADRARNRGFAVSTFNICTFARDEHTPSGQGVPAVLQFCLGEPDAIVDSPSARPNAGRLFGWGPVMLTGAGL
jgi:hypothetical protein